MKHGYNCYTQLLVMLVHKHINSWFLITVPCFILGTLSKTFCHCVLQGFFICKVIHSCIHFLGLAYGCSINTLMHLILRTVPNMASTCVNCHKKGTQTCGDYFILFRRQHSSRNEFLDKMPSLFCSLYPRLAQFQLI